MKTDLRDRARHASQTVEQRQLCLQRRHDHLNTESARGNTVTESAWACGSIGESHDLSLQYELLIGAKLGEWERRPLSVAISS